jgi:hypothetical protein
VRVTHAPDGSSHGLTLTYAGAHDTTFGVPVSVHVPARVVPLDVVPGVTFVVQSRYRVVDVTA